MNMKAFILAAGYGERLKPLTLSIPKPALPVPDMPIISHAIDTCRRAGVVEIGVNLHHLGGKVRRAVLSSLPAGMTATFFEEPVLLGTGGGVKNAEKFLRGGVFAVLNGDTIAGIDLGEAVGFHREKGAVATMVLKPSAEAGKYGTVGIDTEGRVVRLASYFNSGKTAAAECIFAGIHILEPEVLDCLPASGPSCIMRQCLSRLLAEGKPVFGWTFDGFFADIGTPERYAATVFELARTPQNPDAVVFHGLSEIGEGARVGPFAVVGDGCVIGPGASVTRVILLDGARIEAGETVEDCIVFEGGRMPIGMGALGSLKS